MVLARPRPRRACGALAALAPLCLLAAAPSPAAAASGTPVVAVHIRARVDAASELAPLPPLAAVSMASATEGWAVVGTGPGRELAQTTDGGRAWRSALRAPWSVDAIATPDPRRLYVLEEACPRGVCQPTLVEHAAGGSPPLWRTLWRGPPGTGAAMSLLSAQVGYVLAWQGFSPTPASPALWRTGDGGRTWRRLTPRLPALRRGDLAGGSAALDFVSVTRGWLLLGSQPGAGEQGKALLRTSDGGRTWRLVAHSGLMGGHGARGDALPITGYVQSLFFHRDGVGFIGLARGGLLVTRDGGRTFSNAYPREVPPGSDFGAVIGFLASGFAWLYTGFAQPLYVSADAGRRWQAVYPATEPLDLAECPPGEPFGAVTPSDPAAVLGKGDASVPWAHMGEAPGPISAFDAISPDEFAVAYDGGRALAMSQDSGGTWQPLPVPPGYSIDALGLSGPAVGWILASRPSAPPGSAALFAPSLTGGPLRWRRLATPFAPIAATALVGQGDRVGLALGAAPGQMATTLWWTGDGGARWTPVPLPGAAALTAVGSSYGLTWAFGPSRIYLTADAGASWAAIDLPARLAPAQVAFGDAAHGLIVTAQGALWTTADGGRTWRERFPGWPWYTH